MFQTNPKKLHLQRQIMYKKTLAHRNSFLDFNTKKYKSIFTKKRNCPVCFKKKYIKIFDKEGGSFVKCSNCTMVYLNPSFTEKSLIKYYSNNTDAQALSYEGESKFYTRIYNAGIKLIKKYLSGQKQKLLDVGCSSGFFLDIAKKKNFETYGIELNKKEYDIAKKKHITFNKELNEINLDFKFDIICLWDVFEHILNPHKILKTLRSKLKKNGIIFLQIPNSDSLAAKILREKCNVFDPIEHVNLYNKSTIEKIAKVNHFKIVKIISIIDEIKVIKNFLNYDDPYYGNFDESKKIKFLNPSSVHKNYQGYKLQILLKKN